MTWKPESKEMQRHRQRALETATDPTRPHAALENYSNPFGWQAVFRCGDVQL